MTDITVYVRPGSAVVQRWIATAAVLFTAAIVLSMQALANTGQPTHAVAWGSVGLAAYAASLLCLIGGGKERWLGLGLWWIGSWTLLWYGVAFGLASLTYLQPRPEVALISLSSVLRALWLVAVGMTLWVLGYFLGPGRPALRFGNKAMAALSVRFTAEVRSPLAPWILYAIGTAARIATAVTTGRFGYVGDVQSGVTTASSYQQWLSYLSLCAPMGVAAAALQVYRQRVPGARVTLIVLFLAEIVVGAAAGGKQNFIITILAVVIPFTSARRKIPKGMLIFAVLAFLLIIVPFTQAYRTTTRSGTLSASQAFEAVPGTVRQTVATGDVAGVFSYTTSFMLDRISEIQSPAMFMQTTPTQIGFLSPLELVEAPVIDLIPRAVWPGKPIMDPGYQVSQEYFGLPSSVYTSFAVTPIGDLYRHGGWIPVIVGMFLLGCGVRFLDEVMDVSGNPHSVLLFLLLFPSLVKQENDWVGMLGIIPGTLLVWLLAIYLTFQKKSGEIEY
jgi:hypothetical protein